MCIFVFQLWLWSATAVFHYQLEAGAPPQWRPARESVMFVALPLILLLTVSYLDCLWNWFQYSHTFIKTKTDFPKYSLFISLHIIHILFSTCALFLNTCYKHFVTIYIVIIFKFCKSAVCVHTFHHVNFVFLFTAVFSYFKRCIGESEANLLRANPNFKVYTCYTDRCNWNDHLKHHICRNNVMNFLLIKTLY